MLFLFMKNVPKYIMLIITILTVLFSQSLATLKHQHDHSRYNRLLAQELLDRVSRYDKSFDDDPYGRNDDDDDDDREDNNSDEVLEILKSFRQHPRSLRVKPYENYDNEEINYKRGDLYNKALEEIYTGISGRTDVKKQINIHKEKHQLKDKKVNKEVPPRSKDLSNDNTILVRKAEKRSDNNQVASVKVDDTIEKQQSLVSQLDPKDIFLEANVNKSNQNVTKSPSHAHIKANPPPPKTTTTKHSHHGLDETSFIAIIAGCCVAGVAGIMLASFCWYKLRQETISKDEKGSPKVIKKLDSPTSLNKEDDKLVQSAEVFHYLHAKNQMQQMNAPPEKSHFIGSEDEEDEDTVYECPGLAPPGDMKVMNPLFSDAESHHSEKQSDSHSGDSPPPPSTVGKSPSVDKQK